MNNCKKLFSFRTLLLLGIAGCLFCIIPAGKAIIVKLMEMSLGRPLRDLSKWDSILVHSMIYFITIMSFMYFFMYTKKGKPIASTITNTAKDTFITDNSKLQLLAIFIMYFVFYWALIRANYEYADDMRRVYTGHKAWVGWSRYVSEILAVFLHTNFYINDISPVSQLWTIAVLTVTSYSLAYIVMKGNITKTALTTCILIGLNPFYTSNFSYKFDCPYMALAVFFGVMPFIFTKDRLSYIFMSFIGMVLVCTSYQAANSIYIILAIFTAYRMWSENKTWKEIGIFTVISVLCYIAALVFFRLFLMNTFAGDAIHRGTGIAHGSDIFSVAKGNLIQYFSLMNRGYGNIWIKAFTAIAIVLFPFAASVRTQKNKVIAFLFSVIVLITMFLLSFGAYIVLEQALISARAMMGFDVLIALIALYDVYGFLKCNTMKKISTITVICLFYGMGICTTVYGNFISKQKDYEKFRFTILLQDLSHIVDATQHNSIYIGGSIGSAEKTRMEKINYPAMVSYGPSPVLTHYLLTDWNMEFEVLSEDDLGELDLQPEFKKQITELPLIQDTFYHTIYGKGSQYYVYLKAPKVKEWK